MSQTSPYADRTRAEQRQHVLSVLDPRRDIRYEHLMRAVDLAVQHEWNLEREPERHKATAHFATRTIRTPPIHGDLELAVFVHEGGHLESPMGDRDRIDNELLAWRWGMKALGFRWSPAMQREMEACLRTYQPLRIKTYQDLQLMEAVFAEGAEQAGPARSETMNRTAIGGNGQRTYVRRTAHD
jgi:hypothetical protein